MGKKTIFISYWRNAEAFKASGLIPGGILLVIKQEGWGRDKLKVPEQEAIKKLKKEKTKVYEVEPEDLVSIGNGFISKIGNSNVRTVFFEGGCKDEGGYVEQYKTLLRVSGIEMAEQWNPDEANTVWMNKDGEAQGGEPVTAQGKGRAEGSQDDPTGMNGFFFGIKQSRGSATFHADEAYENPPGRYPPAKGKAGGGVKDGSAQSSKPHKKPMGGAPKGAKKGQKEEKNTKKEPPKGRGKDKGRERETEKGTKNTEKTAGESQGKESTGASGRTERTGGFPGTASEAEAKLTEARNAYIYYLRAKLILTMEHYFNTSIDGSSFYRVCSLVLRSRSAEEFTSSVEVSLRFSLKVKEEGFLRVKREASKYYKIINAVEG